MTTKEWLAQYQAALRLATRYFDDYGALTKTLLQSPTLTAMPRGGKQKDLADVVAQMERLRARAEKARERYLIIAEEIETAIDAVPDIRESGVLRLRYILGRHWYEIAEAMHVSEATVYRIHGNALKHVQRPKNDSP